MDSTPLKKALTLQATLANVFYNLINSMDDDNVYVAQKATLYLGTIHDNAMKVSIKIYNLVTILYHEKNFI